MKNEINDIDLLIARQLGGKASPEEQHALQAWLAEAEQHRKFFGAVVSDVKPDTEKALEKFRQHIGARQNRARRLVLATLRYAAVAAVLVGLGVLAWTRISGDTQPAQPALLLAGSTSNMAQALLLSDSSSVMLNKNTSLSSLGSYGKNRRELQLEGEAFFEVASSDEAPLVVHAGEVLVEDIGTAFNVQAYPESDTITVFVQSGEVRFYTEKSSGLSLQAGESATFDRRSKTFARIASDINAVAYKTKLLVFHNKPLHEAIALINEVYNVHLCVRDSSVAMQTISVTFDDESLEEIMEVLGETLHAEIELAE